MVDADHAGGHGAGHGHGHHHAATLPEADPATRRLVALIVVPAALLSVIAMILLWPGEGERARTGRGFEQDVVKGTVATILPGECGTGPQACPEAQVDLTSGPNDGTTVIVPAPSGLGAVKIDAGDKLVLVYEPSVPEGSQYQIIDFQRGTPLLLLAALFALVVVFAGRRAGLAALGGLVISFAVLLMFVLPAILDGTAPLLVAVVGAAVIMFAVLYLTHGVNVWTSVAVLGTLGSLTLTGILGAIFTSAAHFTGLAGESAGAISGLYPQVDVRGLLLAGIVIGSLGVLDDVTVTQSVTVAELARANPAMTRVELYRTASRIGRAHVASTVNTLVLAYAGAALPLLLLFTAGGRPVADLLSNEAVAAEVVRSAVGSIGIVAAVPLTTWLAVLVLPRERTGPAGPPVPPRRRNAGTGRRRRV